MSKEQADVIVVGASAAGLAAAIRAAEAGADVLLLEGKPEIGVPAAPAAVGFDHLWPEGFDVPAACVRRRHDGIRLVSPAGHALRVDAPLRILDRARFDRHLAERFARAGGRLLTGVRGLEARADGTLTAEGLEARADVTVFADGARSLAHRFVPALRHPEALTWGAILEVEHPGARDEARVTLTLGSHARGGRSQLNPLEGDAWTHWTFYRGAPADAEARARVALALDARRRGWPERAAKEARFAGAAPDPVYALPGRLVADGLLVTGGAAGQGGLEMGLASGALAGNVAAAAVREKRRDAAFLRQYEKTWRRRHALGYRLLRLVAERLARLEDREVDDLLKPWDDRHVDVHGAARALLANPRALPALATAAWRAR